MSIIESQAKSVLRRFKRIDSWFLTCTAMNLYRGCMHNCSYCDGRAEKYWVEGAFGKDVVVKVNAIDILKRELDPSRRRKPIPRSFIMPGGGVGDSYQPLEKKYGLTRKTLELLLEFGWPVHILTKSNLVKRDVDLLKAINRQSRALVSVSFSSTDPNITAHFEPGASSPAQRLTLIKQLKSEGISCGMFLMPVIPFISDLPHVMEKSISDAVAAGVDYIVFGAMTLKEGRQKDTFLTSFRDFNPSAEPMLDIIYKGNPWGNAVSDYQYAVANQFLELAQKYKVPGRIPLQLFRDILSDNNTAIAMLEQMHYTQTAKGYTSAYGYAARQIATLTKPLAEMRREIRNVRGIGPSIQKMLWDVLDGKTPLTYAKLVGLPVGNR